MNAHTKPTDIVNAALRSRGMMPMDGHCACTNCGDTGLDRDEMHSAKTCKFCVDGLPNFRQPQDGPHQTAATGVYDYARQCEVFDHG